MKWQSGIDGWQKQINISDQCSGHVDWPTCLGFGISTVACCSSNYVNISICRNNQKVWCFFVCYPRPPSCMYWVELHPQGTFRCTFTYRALPSSVHCRVARWHPRIPNRPQFGIQAACLVSTFFIWYPAKIWYPLRIDLVSNYKFGILGK